MKIRPCYSCGAIDDLTRSLSRKHHVPANAILCETCFEHEICQLSGAHVEIIDGKKYFVGIRLKKDA